VPRPGAYFAAPIRTGPGPQSLPVATQVGRFFRDVRRSFHLSQPEVAQRLATRIDIVAALEAGDVHNLPPWAETCRIVRTYTGLVGLDPRPILRLIEILQASDEGPPLPAPAFDDEEEDERGAFAAAAAGVGRLWHSRFARTTRALVVLGIPVALFLLVTQTSVLEAAISKLPPPVVRFVRGAQNYVIVQLAPVHDGLRWIDVPDPRTRRSDKLQTASQSD